MAQTKTKSRSKSSSSKSKPAKSKSTKPKSSKAKGPKAKASASKGSSGAKPSAKGSSNGAGPQGIASKAKLPLVAGGAALAGAAGGIALAATKQARKSGVAKALARRPKVKIKAGDMAKAAKEVGNFSAQMGELTMELRRARESGNGKKHRSPIEVVLQGLTARR
jgi:hypothetical protein